MRVTHTMSKNMHGVFMKKDRNRNPFVSQIKIIWTAICRENLVTRSKYN